MGYLIVQNGIDFRNIIRAAVFYKSHLYVRQAKIIYRDTIKGRKQLQETVEWHEKLVTSLKNQGIDVLDVPPDNKKRKKPRKSFDLDTLLKIDLKEAIENPKTRAIILMSGDNHFAPYVKMAHEKGIEVIVISDNGSLSPNLADLADQAINLQDLFPVLMG